MVRRVVNPALRLGAVAVTAAWIGAQSLGGIAVAEVLTPQQVSQFLANPGSILPPNGRAGAELVSKVRDLMLSASDADKTTVLNDLIALLANASPAQQGALGSGLGLAAQGLASNQALVAEIQAALARANNPTAIAAYSGVTGNVVIGAAGGGGGGGGGGPVNNGPPFGNGGGNGPGNGVGQQVGSQGFTMSGGASAGFNGQGPVTNH